MKLLSLYQTSTAAPLKFGNVHYQKNLFENHTGNDRIWHFYFLEMALHQTEQNIATLMKLSRVVLWGKVQFEMSEMQDTK